MKSNNKFAYLWFHQLRLWCYNSHFGAYLIKLSRFYEEIDLKWHTFRKGTFQGSSIARQIYHLDSWNLVQNCPIASSYRNIYQCLTIISYIVFRILNVREGYPHPKTPNFNHWPEDGVWWQIHPLQLLHHSNWMQNIRYKSISDM